MRKADIISKKCVSGYTEAWRWFPSVPDLGFVSMYQGGFSDRDWMGA